jgi:RNA polymerase sigma-70 factor, ECF subfamily
MESGQGQPITLLLQRWHAGDSGAATELFPLVYDELRRLASSYVRRERDLSICRTELVHELYVKLQKRPPDVEDRSHFFGIAARLMRQILVDLAREQKRLKRQQDPATLWLGDVGNSPGRPVDVLVMDQCLDRLRGLDPRKGDIVELRYFGGLTVEEIGTELSISQATVKREWKVARMWLLRELDRNGESVAVGGTPQ